MVWRGEEVQKKGTGWIFYMHLSLFFMSYSTQSYFPDGDGVQVITALKSYINILRMRQKNNTKESNAENK